MKVVFNCCTQPAKYTHNAGVTLFKGEKPEVEAKSQVKPEAPQNAETITNPVKNQKNAEAQPSPQLKPQPEKDVVEISGKDKK